MKIKGDGEMHMTLSSSLLPNLNRQLQFVTYTNTHFHPSTADAGEDSLRCLHQFSFKYNFIFCLVISRHVIKLLAYNLRMIFGK